MMTMIPMEDDRVIGVRIDGHIRVEEMETMVEAVEAKLGEHEKLRAYVELEALGDIDLKALLADLKMGLDHWHRFERKATVTDMKWISTVADIVAPLFPTIELKVFPTVARDSAIAWISE